MLDVDYTDASASDAAVLAPALPGRRIRASASSPPETAGLPRHNLHLFDDDTGALVVDPEPGRPDVQTGHNRRVRAAGAVMVDAQVLAKALT